MSKSPTPYPDVNSILRELLESVRNVLGSHLIGMYLDGSLANGDFDEDSDIDFVVVTDEEISGALFLALQAMHDRIATMDSPFAIQLEGSYISRRGLRHYDPEHALYPNIERGQGERLKKVVHDDWWIVHRYILRERGITITGPAPRTLLDPVPPDDLRRAMVSILKGWATQILQDPDRIRQRGYQSYVVLSLCRILYTLQHGEIVSKHRAARWARETLGEQWAPLIDQAWVGRHHPQEKADPEDIQRTLDFIRFALDYCRRSKMS